MELLKRTLLITLMFSSLLSFAQFSEKGFDIGVGAHVGIDVFDMTDVIVPIELRYNRSEISFGPKIGTLNDELGDGPSGTKINGFAFSYDFRLNKIYKKVNFYLDYYLDHDSYYVEYKNDIQQRIKYESDSWVNCIGFQTNYNFYKKFYLVGTLGFGYRTSNREIKIPEIFDVDNDPESGPVFLISIGVKYNVFLFPSKGSANNRTF